jgi:hypothetical protein
LLPRQTVSVAGRMPFQPFLLQLGQVWATNSAHQLAQLCGHSRIVLTRNMRVHVERETRIAVPKPLLSYLSRILDPPRQCDHAVMSQDISKQWVDSGIVDIRSRHAFSQVVENDDFRTTT